jgi:lipoprotein NlpD
VALALFAGCATARARAPLHPVNPQGTWYVVQAGETLQEIAGRAGVPVQDLMEINGLDRAEAVRPGQSIFVLDAEALSRSSAGTPTAVASAPPPAVAPEPAAGATPPDDGADAAFAGKLRWPLAEPKLSSPFGPRAGRPHEGIDLAAPLGTPILAAANGQVVYAGDGVSGYGNMVVLQHPDGLLTVYAHNSLVMVRTGDTIAAGQEIARVGMSGRATAPHLHFEVRRAQLPRDPLRFLPAPPAAFSPGAGKSGK